MFPMTSTMTTNFLAAGDVNMPPQQATCPLATTSRFLWGFLVMAAMPLMGILSTGDTVEGSDPPNTKPGKTAPATKGVPRSAPAKPDAFAELHVPPTWIAPAFEHHHTTLEFYDPVKVRKTFPGWTDFEYSVAHQYDYRYELKDDGQSFRRVILMPTFKKLDIKIKHRIQLPLNYERIAVFDTALGKHELEHVAIGAHPRVMLLSHHLMKRAERIEKKVEKSFKITNPWVTQVINDEINSLRLAVDELIKTNNRQLDKLTGHGNRPIPEHHAFYDEMYLKQNLDTAKFPYLSDVLLLLETTEYERAVWDFEAK